MKYRPLVNFKKKKLAKNKTFYVTLKNQLDFEKQTKI